jgi:hypothetical protein
MVINKQLIVIVNYKTYSLVLVVVRTHNHIYIYIFPSITYFGYIKWLRFVHKSLFTS